MSNHDTMLMVWCTSGFLGLLVLFFIAIAIGEHFSYRGGISPDDAQM